MSPLGMMSSVGSGPISTIPVEDSDLGRPAMVTVDFSPSPPRFHWPSCKPLLGQSASVSFSLGWEATSLPPCSLRVEQEAKRCRGDRSGKPVDLVWHDGAVRCQAP